MLTINPVTHDQLEALHREVIDEPEEIDSILDRLSDSGGSLWCGLNRRIESETAQIRTTDGKALNLETRDFESLSKRREITVNFSLGSKSCFFTGLVLGANPPTTISVAKPDKIYVSDRRERARVRAQEGERGRIRLKDASGRTLDATVVDESAGGFSIRYAPAAWLSLSTALTFERVDALENTINGCATPVYIEEQSGEGLTRAGLRVRPPRLIDFKEIGLINEESASLATSGGCESDFEPNVVRYETVDSEEIVGLIDCFGDAADALGVIIPSSWGRTKETLLPLARTIVETFKSIGQSVVVLRFDSVRSRGESHNDPEGRRPGFEAINWTLSQSVKDLRSSVDFLESEFGVRKQVIVSFSVSAVWARKVVATGTDGKSRILGWCSVVGPGDLRKAIKLISGGVDFLGGTDQGISFGVQEILGLPINQDRVGRDAAENGLLYLEDSNADFEKITCPVTWIHGRDDAWMDFDRVRETMSFGDTTKRDLIVVPTGHQLKSSDEATQIFRLITSACASMALGKQVDAVAPDKRELKERAQAERSRIPALSYEKKQFWRRYLLGRDGMLGMEVFAKGSDYRQFVQLQIDRLDLRSGHSVLDLGAGTGSFIRGLEGDSRDFGDLSIVEADLVQEALKKIREENGQSSIVTGLSWARIDADLIGRNRSLAFKDGAFDAALLSLVLGYLADPEALLEEVWRILRPGGRLVMSNLRRDADISKLAKQLRHDIDALAPMISVAEKTLLERSLQNAINEGSKILDLEEAGRFFFWSQTELEDLARRAGFASVASEASFGDPPQAVVVTAVR